MIRHAALVSMLLLLPVATGAQGIAVPSANTPVADHAVPVPATDARQFAQQVVVPAYANLGGATRRLQNAVLRHCAARTPLSRDALSAAFDNTVIMTAQIVPLAFGSDAALALPERLLTEVESTAASRATLEALVRGRVVSIVTLEELSGLEDGLRSLSALERLLLPNHLDENDDARCFLGTGIVAGMFILVADARVNWELGRVVEHWQGDNVDLAQRLRLRDLIQSAINAIDRFDRDLADFSEQRRNNGNLPFSDPQRAHRYLLTLAEALGRQIALLRQFAGDDQDAQDILEGIEQALMVGCQRLEAAVDEDPGPEGDYIVPFDQAHADIIERLPAAFGFDASAFERPVTSFELLRDS